MVHNASQIICHVFVYITLTQYNMRSLVDKFILDVESGMEQLRGQTSTVDIPEGVAITGLFSRLTVFVGVGLSCLLHICITSSTKCPLSTF